MSSTSTGRWRLLAKTKAGHVVLIADRLSEEEVRDMYDCATDALLHVSKYGAGESEHVLHGPVGVVRLDAVEAVSINEDISAGRR